MLNHRNIIIMFITEMITIFVKRVTGKTERIDFDENKSAADLVVKIFETAANDNNLSIEKWLQYNTYLFLGRDLKYEISLKDQGFINFSSMHEIKRPITMSYNYDSATQKIDGDIEDPILLNPGCLHILSKSMLLQFVDNDGLLLNAKSRSEYLQNLAKIYKKNPKCFHCREPIDIINIADCVNKPVNKIEQLVVKKYAQSL